MRLISTVKDSFDVSRQAILFKVNSLFNIHFLSSIPATTSEETGVLKKNRENSWLYASVSTSVCFRIFELFL